MLDVAKLCLLLNNAYAQMWHNCYRVDTIEVTTDAYVMRAQERVASTDVLPILVYTVVLLKLGITMTVVSTHPGKFT